MLWFFLSLRRSELAAAVLHLAVSFNKVSALSLVCAALLLTPLLAGRGGEEKRGRICSITAVRDGGGSSVLLLRRSGRRSLLAWLPRLLRWKTTAALPGASSRFGNKRLWPRCSNSGALVINLAGRGGEEEDEDGVGGVSMCGLLLPQRASSTVAFLATGIHGRGGPDPRLVSVISTSRREAFLGLGSGLQRSFSAKWFVPGRVEAAGGENPATVEGSKDLFAFLENLLGSSQHISGSFLQFLVCKGPTYNLYPLFD
jgi:hypothetical protein